MCDCRVKDVKYCPDPECCPAGGAHTSAYNLLAQVRTTGKVWPKILSRLLFGAVAVATMLVPFQYAPGVIYDGRSIVLALAGLFGGGTAALPALLAAGIYRAWLGGNGMWAGLATILTSGLLGLAFRRLSGNRPGGGGAKSAEPG